MAKRGKSSQFERALAGLRSRILSGEYPAGARLGETALAEQLGVDAKPFIMAVAFAASTAMATPMGYQTNLLVYGPGGYTYRDFVAFGMPLNIAIGVIACLLIPLLWPF